MAYTDRNFKTKKELKAAVDAGKQIGVFNPGLGGAVHDGKICIEGPHYPQPHSWYATVEVKGGVIVKGSVK